MLLIDLEKKSIVSDQEIKKEISEKSDWKKLVQLSQVNIENIPETEKINRLDNDLPKMKLLQA